MEDDVASDAADEEDEAGLAWYAAAAAGGTDENVAENAEDDNSALASLDPYLSSEDPGMVDDACPEDPYLAADPYSESCETQTPETPSVAAQDPAAISATVERVVPLALANNTEDAPMAGATGVKRLPPVTPETACKELQTSIDAIDGTATASLGVKAQCQDSTSPLSPPRKVQKTQAHAQMTTQRTSIEPVASIPAPLAKPNQKLECPSQQQSSGLHTQPLAADQPKLEQPRAKAQMPEPSSIPQIETPSQQEQTGIASSAAVVVAKGERASS
jgi:hypothetical protein